MAKPGVPAIFGSIFIGRRMSEERVRIIGEERLEEVTR